jgi:hypothetical protein
MGLQYWGVKAIVRYVFEQVLESVVFERPGVVTASAIGSILHLEHGSANEKKRIYAAYSLQEPIQKLGLSFELREQLAEVWDRGCKIVIDLYMVVSDCLRSSQMVN